MSMDDFFDSIFGGRYGGKGRPPENEDGDILNPASDKFWNNHGDKKGDFTPSFDFKISDPFEMHSYFEKRMNEIMKSFFSPGMFPGIEGFGTFDTPGEPPAIKEKQHPRDFYLKPDFRRFKNEEGEEKQSVLQPSDKGWLDRFLPSSPEEPSQFKPRTFSSFRSVVRRSVTLPDGSVKTEEIIRNSDGTEEKTETHIQHDGNYIPPSGIEIGIPDFSGWFDQPNWSGIKKTIPRDHFLKPGYEKADENSLKIDTDLDKQILQSGIDILPSFSKVPELVDPSHGFKSITKRVVTLPNGGEGADPVCQDEGALGSVYEYCGRKPAQVPQALIKVVKSEEIVRNPDGTEQRTVMKTLPDGTSIEIDSDPNIKGSNTDSFKNYQSLVDSPSPLSLTLKGVKDLLDIFFK